MYQQVAVYVGRCEVCDQVRSSFKTLSPQLQPLPIMELGYRWSLDFAGLLVVTPRGPKYVLVMVEHFSKWIELVALPQKSTMLAATAFLGRVLARFGAPAEILTDQGREFLGAQHCDTLRYARIRSVAYEPELRRIRQGIYVYFQHVAPTTLDVKAGCTIL